MATQRNFKWYRYVDDQDRNWAIRADADWGDSAASGLAAFNPLDPPFGPQSARHHPRAVIYEDPATFRTFRGIMGTAAAYAAAPATTNVIVPGNVAAVAYNQAARVPEKLQIPKVSRNATDHA